jgi:hypothetical protein
MAHDPEDCIGIAPGQSIPLQRHGENGVLYNPITKLTVDELMLYGRVSAQFDRTPDNENTRENFLRVLQTIAGKTINDPTTRQTMVEHVTSYADELVLAFNLQDARQH